jgi:hypothetical protein
VTHIISFKSSQFDVTAETPNPINPIAGESLLGWLRGKLIARGYEVTAPEPEDWGWYVDLRSGEKSYLVGASCDLDQAEPRDWIVQVRLERSLTDKLFGRNKMADNDAVSAHIEALIRESGGALEVEVDRR